MSPPTDQLLLQLRSEPNQPMKGAISRRKPKRIYSIQLYWEEERRSSDPLPNVSSVPTGGLGLGRRPEMSITGQSGQGVVPPITGPPESQLHSVLQGNLASCKSFAGQTNFPSGWPRPLAA